MPCATPANRQCGTVALMRGRLQSDKTCVDLHSLLLEWLRNMWGISFELQLLPCPSIGWASS
uniref:Uncharacterized protein n=1 Tax=Arundo donax TaxID=35708 RepID=A0A0A9DYL7_ARUDO